MLLLAVLVDAVISTEPCLRALIVSPSAKLRRNSLARGTRDGRPFPLFAAVTGRLWFKYSHNYIGYILVVSVTKKHLIFTRNVEFSVAIGDSQYFSADKLLGEFIASAR